MRLQDVQLLRSPRQKGSSVNVPPQSRAGGAGSGQGWGNFRWPQMGEFGWPPGGGADHHRVGDRSAWQRGANRGLGDAVLLVLRPQIAAENRALTRLCHIASVQ